jgi:hypothetical protein
MLQCRTCVRYAGPEDGPELAVLRSLVRLTTDVVCTDGCCLHRTDHGMHADPTQPILSSPKSCDLSGSITVETTP